MTRDDIFETKRILRPFVTKLRNHEVVQAVAITTTAAVYEDARKSLILHGLPQHTLTSN